MLQWGLALAIPSAEGLELVTYNFWVAPGISGGDSDDQRFLCQASLYGIGLGGWGLGFRGKDVGFRGSAWKPEADEGEEVCLEAQAA